MEIVCFYAGIAFFYFKSIYPIALIGCALFIRPKMKFIVWSLFGIAWSFLHQWLIDEPHLTQPQVIKHAAIEGIITSIPKQTSSKTEFQFLIEHQNGQKSGQTALISCYKDCPLIHPGEYWALHAKLKTPVNLANPGGFDYHAWLSSRHITWVGTIYPHGFKKLSAARGYRLMNYQETLLKRIESLYPDKKTVGILEALTLGVTYHIDKAQWDLFRKTGTTHLIDISGEHIAMVSGIIFFLVKWLCKRIPRFCLYYPAPKIAGLIAMLTAIGYALIAGFAVPTQRALVMSCLMLAGHLISHRIAGWQAWRHALLAVLLYEPHAVYSLGFYFSFIAVAILMLTQQRFQCRGIKKMLILQAACLFGLMPLSLYWFSYASLNGLFANLIAIPWVGLFIVPQALCMMFLSSVFVIPGTVALLEWCISNFVSCLKYIDNFTQFNIIYSYPKLLFPLALIATMTSLALIPLKRSSLIATIILIASLFPRYEKVKTGEVKIDVLDVGQGLAVLVRTMHHVLIYDTGMQFYKGGDMGKLAIIPYLNLLNIKQIDKIVISHTDLDHRGGLNSLKTAYDLKELLVDDPSFYHEGLPCHHYPAWVWDGISFQFLPLPANASKKNNHSCTLKISHPKGQFLLAGDIEKPAERYLLKHYPQLLRSSILLIPHHGSKTSSSIEFIEGVHPKYAVVSYGFDNRYQFPHQQAINRYQAHHIPIYSTKACGMISIRLNDGELKPVCGER